MGESLIERGDCVITEVVITLGKTVPHPAQSYALLRAEVSAKCVNTEGVTTEETDALRLFVHYKLYETLQRLIDEAKTSPAGASKERTS